MQTGVVATLGLLLFLGSARAGDPIKFSDDKAKAAPANERPVDSDIFKSWNKSSGRSGSPLNSLTPFITPGQSLDKEDRRLRNAREERKNWMLLEPGELQKRDDEEELKFGGRDFSLDSGDDDGGNYLFYGLTEPSTDKVKDTPRRAPVDFEDAPKKDNSTSLKIFGGRGDEPGAHTARELNLKGLIDTRQVDPVNFHKTEPSLYQFFKDNAVQTDRDAQARRDSFREFINGPQPNAPSPGLADSINFRPDLTQERINPVIPSRPGFELPGAAKVPDAFSLRPPGGGFNPARPLGLPDSMTPGPRQPLPGPYLPSPYLMPNEPPKTPRAGIMNSPLFNREAPRRGGI